MCTSLAIARVSDHQLENLSKCPGSNSFLEVCVAQEVTWGRISMSTFGSIMLKGPVLVLNCVAVDKNAGPVNHIL